MTRIIWVKWLKPHVLWSSSRAEIHSEHKTNFTIKEVHIDCRNEHKIITCFFHAEIYWSSIESWKRMFIGPRPTSSIENKWYLVTKKKVKTAHFLSFVMPRKMAKCLVKNARSQYSFPCINYITVGASSGAHYLYERKCEKKIRNSRLILTF